MARNLRTYIRGFSANIRDIMDRFGFDGRQNIRNWDTFAQIQHVAAAMVGRRLLYQDLVAGDPGTAT